MEDDMGGQDRSGSPRDIPRFQMLVSGAQLPCRLLCDAIVLNSAQEPMGIILRAACVRLTKGWWSPKDVPNGFCESCA